MKVVVFGAGQFGKKYIEECTPDIEIVAVCDNNWNRLKYGGGGSVYGHKICSPNIMKELCFDYIMIAIDEFRENGLNIILDIKNQLLDLGVSENKILLMSEDKGQDNKILYPRVQFLSDLAEMYSYCDTYGAIAECGVYRGHFAQKMNEVFPDRTLYLFDTFSGFDERDIQCESETMDRKTLSQASEVLAEADEDVVMLKFKHKDHVIIKSGYVPETFKGLEEERFLFVNLDMDLYQPTIAALRFFADKMVDGGVILVHDYFIYKNAPCCWGARKAVDDFSAEYPIVKLPIGDNRSLAIARQGKKHTVLEGDF